MSIELVNLRKEKPQHRYDIRVDHTSPLGNPFKGGTKNSQCDWYAENFQGLLQNSAAINELRRLYRIHQKYGQLRLFCWCVPLRCHSETIKAFLDSARKQAIG